jgi:hypothetical protein
MATSSRIASVSTSLLKNNQYGICSVAYRARYLSLKLYSSKMVIVLTLNLEHCVTCHKGNGMSSDTSRRVRVKVIRL